MLYRKGNLEPKEQREEYKKCIDILLSFYDEQSPVTDFIYSYSADVFTRMAMMDLLPYLKDGYVEKFKSKSAVVEEIEKTIKLYDRLKPGNKAPNFSLKDIVGNTFELHKHKSEYTMLMFWASWCGHCRHTLPNVKILYDEQPFKKVQIVALSMDRNEEEWKNFIAEGEYNWINLSELQGWEGTINKEYMVHSTPTFYMLDKDKKIVKVSKQIGELESYFK